MYVYILYAFEHGNYYNRDEVSIGLSTEHVLYRACGCDCNNVANGWYLSNRYRHILLIKCIRTYMYIISKLLFYEIEY